jgi:DNA adenine methylase
MTKRKQMMDSKPIFMWAGGKTRLLKYYEQYMPSKMTSYCEPFFGGGAMFIYVMSRYSPEKVIINDINESITSIYSSIRNDYDVFIDRLNQLESQYLPLDKPSRKRFYYEIRDEHAWNYEKYSLRSEEAATLYFLMKTGFNGIFQINKNTNGRYGTPSGLLNQKDFVYDRKVLKWWNDKLQRTTILSGSWKDAVAKAPSDTFFFFDPPYRNSFADYGNSFNDKCLSELIDFASKKNQVMLSNRDDDGWLVDKRKGMSYTHFDVTYTAGRRKRTEEGYKAKPAREILLYQNKVKG